MKHKISIWHKCKTGYLTGISLLIFLLNTTAQTYPGKTLGGIFNDTGNKIISLADSNYLIIGTTKSFDAQQDDILIIKTDKTGYLLRKKILGWDHGDIGSYIISSSKGGYIATGTSWDFGYGRQDIRLLKLDYNLNIEWNLFLGGNQRDQGFYVTEYEDKGYIVAGYSRSFEINGDVYVALVDYEGHLIWERSLGTPYVDYGFGVTLSQETDEMYIIGNAGGFYNPTENDFMNHDSNVLVIKMNASGDTLWQKTYGGESHDFGKSILYFDENNIYVLGSTQSFGAGNFDVFLLKIDSAGNMLWNKTYGGKDFDYGSSFFLDAGNHLYILGSSNSHSNNLNPDILVIKTDTSGNEIWSKVIGGNDSEYGRDIIGTNNGSAIIGETNSYGYGNKDAYLVFLDAEGTVINYTNPEIENKIEVITYPNPARYYTILRIITQQQTVDYTLSIYKTTGQRIFEKPGVDNEMFINTASWGPGIFIYKITFNGLPELTGKIIILQ
ncbi:MAG: T9SS type A sorting domain-containing protein [Calditrichaeota bacterium]|nr:T9SS type A sorting domain-containing protein [Calditrichota bacterium]